MAQLSKRQEAARHSPDPAGRQGDAAGGEAAAGLDLLVLDAPASVRPRRRPLWRCGRHRLARQLAALRGVVPGRRRTSPPARCPAIVPDLVHAHDWQAALAPAYLRYAAWRRAAVGGDHPQPRLPGPVRAAIFGGLGLPPQAWSVDGVEYYGGVGYLKAGHAGGQRDHHGQPDLCAGDPHAAVRHGARRPGQQPRRAISTASSTASTPTCGTRRPIRIIARNYSAADAGGARAPTARPSRQRFGLDHDDAPLFCVVSRLTWQKGIDMLCRRASTTSSACGGKLAVLGSGDAALEGALLAAAARHPGRVGVVIGYDEPLSHLHAGRLRRDPGARRASSRAA